MSALHMMRHLVLHDFVRIHNAILAENFLAALFGHPLRMEAGTAQGLEDFLAFDFFGHRLINGTVLEPLKQLKHVFRGAASGGHVRKLVLPCGIAEALEDTAATVVLGALDDAKVDEVAELDVAIDMVDILVVCLGMEPGECHEFVDAEGDVSELDVGVHLSLSVAVSCAPTVVVLLPQIGLQGAKAKPCEGVDDALLTDVERHVG